MGICCARHHLRCASARFHSSHHTHNEQTKPQTATQPIQSLLLPQDFVASNADATTTNADDDDDDADIEDGEAKVESALPDGWEKGVMQDGREGYVSMTSLREQAERPTRAASWTPWRFY